MALCLPWALSQGLALALEAVCPAVGVDLAVALLYACSATRNRQKIQRITRVKRPLILEGERPYSLRLQNDLLSAEGDFV